MTEKKKRPVWVIPLLVILLIIFSPMGLVAMIYGYVACEFQETINSKPYPGEPTVIHAEFPCTLVYKLNGEEITLTDTIICEYDGIDFEDGGLAYRRQWTEDFRSGDSVFVLAENDDGTRFEFQYWNVAPYLMGETDYPEYKLRVGSGVYLIETNGYRSKIDDYSLYHDYGIRIVSFEYGPPIENRFAPATYNNHSCAPSNTTLTAAECIPAS